MITIIMRTAMNKKGFTLVELLVVIAIIGILSAVVYASFDGARQQARNKAMMSELKEVQLALEVYKAQTRSYPPSGTYPGNLTAALVPGYISKLPISADSRNPNCSITYTSDANGSFYKLTATRCLEGATSAAQGIQADADFARCPSTCEITPGTCAGSTYNAGYVQSAAFYESLAVYSAGGECQ